MSDDDKARHDFKNQLAIIRGFAEILLAEETMETRRRDLEEIHRAAVNALGLLEPMFPSRADAPHLPT